MKCKLEHTTYNIWNRASEDEKKKEKKNRELTEEEKGGSMNDRLPDIHVFIFVDFNLGRKGKDKSVLYRSVRCFLESIWSGSSWGSDFLI
jgi:hypothetical protein